MSWKDILKFDPVEPAPEGHDDRRYEIVTQNISEEFSKILSEQADEYFGAKSSPDNFALADMAHDGYMLIYDMMVRQPQMLDSYKEFGDLYFTEDNV